MASAPPGPAPQSWLDAIVEAARRKPGTVLAVLLAFHLVVWTALPLLVCPNLQLDLAEDLALGREWQLGYWKHPPLPWWTADLLYRLTGTIHSVYVLGALSATLCFYAVWLLARDTAGPFRGLIAVAALEGVHFYNLSVVKFAHDQMQLPFWAFTAWFLHRALTRGRAADWLLAGVCLAGAFWSKYAVFALAIPLGLFVLLDPFARRALRTPGPYVMALAFLAVIAPNAWWLIQNDFLPLHYVDVRARLAERWWEYPVFPLRWAVSQLFFLLPAIALMALLYGRGSGAVTPADERVAFDRRYVAMLALGPFVVVTLVFGALGRLPIAMWGYPLWSFAPLAVLVWWPPADELRRLKRFAAGAVAVTIAFPVVYAAIEIGEPFLRDRPKATEFPGRVVAASITRQWRDRFGTPLTYIGGSEFATNNVAVYSPDRPHVIVHGDLKLSPWIEAADLKRRGGVLVWEGEADGPQVAQWLAAYGTLTFAPPISVPRQTFAKVAPVRVNIAFIAPQP